MSQPIVPKSAVDQGTEETVSHGDTPPRQRCIDCGGFHAPLADLLPEMEELLDPVSAALEAREVRLDAEDEDEDFDEDEDEDEKEPRPRAELEAELALARRLLVASQGDPKQIERLQQETGSSVENWLSDLGYELGHAGMVDEGVALCRSLATTLKRRDFAGDAARILSRAERREEALAAVAALLAEAPEDTDALEAAGDVFEVCGELERAERSYRRILELTSPKAEPELIGRTVLSLSDLLREAERHREADALEDTYDRFLDGEDDDEDDFEVPSRYEPPMRRPALVPEPVSEGRLVASGEDPYQRPAAKVGRNAPCPCGSGKKYKKCCGADG